MVKTRSLLIARNSLLKSIFFFISYFLLPKGIMLSNDSTIHRFSQPILHAFFSFLQH